MNSLERAIARSMAGALKSSGFSLVAARNAFVRSTSYGHDSLSVIDMGTAAPGPKHHQISIHCAIRHDAVEVSWNTLGLVYGDGQLETATLVLGFPRGVAAPKLKVFPETQEADIERIASEGLSIFNEVALPFYSQFSDVAAIEQLANKTPLADLTPYTVGLAMEHRAFRSMILAKLVNPGRYAQVRDKFLALNVGMFPLERRLAMLSKVDSMSSSGAGTQ